LIVSGRQRTLSLLNYDIVALIIDFAPDSRLVIGDGLGLFNSLGNHLYFFYQASVIADVSNPRFNLNVALFLLFYHIIFKWQP
jgi:hypothetical protein